MTDFHDQQDPVDIMDHFYSLDIGEMDSPDQTDRKARRDMEELSLAAFLRNIPDEGYRILMLMVEMLQELDDPSRKTASASLQFEKIRRGIPLTDSDAEALVLDQIRHLLFDKISCQEFLRRMSLIAHLSALEEE
ncbi:hypothetical protein [Desulforhabdus sp. TSK]|uniref:hypothetical protein n=1 Tax=Desulforhabdus sp. TSK TaxID=2925014 RepID=UPI001FC87FB4|nr:hypothetical protein [Desulforhabdus sp. TSK]GKT09803.1 hypothetical protein DSTSK_31080 [Desulforhabdus sp. TSK]